MLKYLSIILIINIFFTQEYVNYGNNIYSIVGDSRINAMGGSNPSLYGSSGQIYSNPALNHIYDSNVISFSYRNQFSGLIDMYAYSFPLISNKYGLGILYSTIKDIAYTNDAFYFIGDQVIPISGNNLITYFDDTEIIAVFSLIAKYNKIKYGLNIKSYFHSIYNEKAIGIGFDFGSIYRINSTTIFGIILQNIPITTKYWTTGFQEILMPILGSGITYKNDNHTITTSIMFELYRQMDSNINKMLLTSFGYNYNFMENIDFRLGIRDVNIFSIGMGFIKKPFLIDYAFIYYNKKILNNSHEFTIGIYMDEIFKLSEYVKP